MLTKIILKEWSATQNEWFENCRDQETKMVTKRNYWKLNFMKRFNGGMELKSVTREDQHVTMIKGTIHKMILFVNIQRSICKQVKKLFFFDRNGNDEISIWKNETLKVPEEFMEDMFLNYLWRFSNFIPSAIAMVSTLEGKIPSGHVSSLSRLIPVELACNRYCTYLFCNNGVVIQKSMQRYKYYPSIIFPAALGSYTQKYNISSVALTAITREYYTTRL